ncbi:MAG: hypothetical protein CSA26_13325 [Desulfobacterales bacterium]|nr:MAG: hypothetical protein CSA26_13325 [Desulfobacterales bacterium]
MVYAMKTIKYTTCPLDCPDTCGLEAEIVDGRLVSLQGAKNHPYTNGFICAKMRGYVDRFYDEKRILYPMKRKGKKGEEAFQRIGWDEAWDILVTQLTEINATVPVRLLKPYVPQQPVLAGNIIVETILEQSPHLRARLNCSLCGGLTLRSPTSISGNILLQQEKPEQNWLLLIPMKMKQLHVLISI